MTQRAATGEFDVVVVGAGMAGLCCAAELLRSGARVALIAETPEVAWNIRTKDVAGNIGWMQHPVWNASWGGGWWYQLVRNLNISVDFEFTPPMNVVLMGNNGESTTAALPFTVSAAGIVRALSHLSPIPIDSMIDELTEILRDALAIHYLDLQALADVPLMRWLADRDASPEICGLFAALAGLWMFSTPEEGAREISVFGLFSALRIMQNSETPVVTIKPDPWSGLALPIAEKIEEMGGVILRGSLLSHIIVEDGHATGAAFPDGREVRGRAVAFAGGTSRLPRLLRDMPSDIQAAVDYAATIDLRETDLFAVLNKPVVPLKSYTIVLDSSFKFRCYISPLHVLGPWSTKPGKQFFIIESITSPEEYATLGREKVIENLESLLEELYPGFADALESKDVMIHRHAWQSSMTHGPKLPRRSSGISDLWFVGDGTSPVLSIGIEYASGAGILGAREIAADLKIGDCA